MSTSSKGSLSRKVALPVSERKPKVQSHTFRVWQQTLVRSDSGTRIKIIRSGAAAIVMASASEHFNMPRARFASVLGMSPATAERKIKSGSVLGHFESERLARIAMIESEADDVFGDAKMATAWLLQKNLALGDTPLSLLDTETGAFEVRKALSAIAYGGVV